MKFATVATHNSGYMDQMLESSKKYNIDVDLIAYGKKWEGYHMKIKELQKYLENIDDDEIVCFFDAYDVLFCGSQEKLKTSFLTMEKDNNIIIGCHERPGVIIDYYMKNIYDYDLTDEIPTKYKYLCSGTIMSRAKWMKKALSYHTDDFVDDQVYWYYLYHEKKDLKIRLDYENKLFYTSSPPKNIINFMLNRGDSSDIVIKNGRVLNKVTNSIPSLIHSPGDIDMSHIHKEFGLQLSKGNHNSRLYKKFGTYAKGLKVSIFFISILVILTISYLTYRNIYAGLILLAILLLI